MPRMYHYFTKTTALCSRRRRLLAAAVGLGTLLALLLTSWCSFGRVCAQVRGQTLRLHVLANSDSSADQALKLQVRDALVARCAALFGQADSLQAAEDKAAEALPALQRLAQQVVADAGYSYPVSLRLGEEYFGTRSYGQYTLPAGRYRALIVTLGAGGGHNWWCVLFPPLCIPAAQPPQQEAAAVWGQEGVQLATGDFQLRFALLEWWEQLRQSREDATEETPTDAPVAPRA